MFVTLTICAHLCRLFVMGFLGGNEMKDAGLGNLGLQDRELVIDIIFALQ